MKVFSLPITADTHEAELECYLLDMSPKIRWKARPAAVVCPGGAYSFTNDREAEPIAAFFLSMGFHVFVLRYTTERGSYPTALRQLAAAVGQIRERAEEWFVDPKQLILCGFSAGGHLAAEFACRWSEPGLSEQTGMSAEQLRPQALVLGYPVITAGEHTHALSVENLLGDRDTPELRREISLENRVGKDVPPTFLWHTASDEMVPVENSLLFASALSRNGIPFELHVYPFGVHGLGLSDRCTVEAEKHVNDYCTVWTAELRRFLEHYLPLET